MIEKESTRVRTFVPTLPKYKALKRYLKRIDDRRIYSNSGPLVLELELRLAGELGVDPREVVLGSSATILLEAAITCSMDQDIEWTCPSWTFAASALALKRCHKNFGFVDVGSDWRAISDSGFMRNNLLVLPFGDEINPSDRPRNTNTLLIDAAASLPSYLQKNNLNRGPRDGTVFSLHATKLLSTGEGGLFVSTNLDWVEGIRRWLRFGFGSERISVQEGTNGKISEYAAAIGLSSMDLWPKFVPQIKELMQWSRLVSENNNLKVSPALSKSLISPYWIVELESKKQKDKLVTIMEKHNIETRDWWGSCCHTMPFFKDVPIKSESLENSESLASRTIGLPLHLELTDKERQRIEIALYDFSSQLI